MSLVQTDVTLSAAHCVCGNLQAHLMLAFRILQVQYVIKDTIICQLILPTVSFKTGLPVEILFCFDVKVDEINAHFGKNAYLWT